MGNNSLQQLQGSSPLRRYLVDSWIHDAGKRAFDALTDSLPGAFLLAMARAARWECREDKERRIKAGKGHYHIKETRPAHGRKRKAEVVEGKTTGG